VVGEGGEAGADGLAGRLIQEATRGKVDGAEDGAAPVGAWGHDLLALAPEDPGGPHPRQQVAVGLVLGPQHRTSGQIADVLVEVGEDLVAVGVAACDQAGPPPAGDLAHTAVQGPPADSWAAQLLPQPADGPGLGLAEQPADALAQPGAAQSWTATAGPLAQPAGAVLGQQDHHQAAADAVGPVPQAQQVAGAAGWAGGVGVHAGGRILQAASSGRWCCGRLQRPARLLHQRSPAAGVTTQLQAGRFAHAFDVAQLPSGNAPRSS
jgi:hypothetical protein